jgi:hypothetical protein
VLNVEQQGRMEFEQMSDFSQEAVIAQAQEAVLFELGLMRSPVQAVTRYSSLPLLALEVDAEQRAVLEASPWVTGVQEAQWRVADLAESVPLIGMTGPNGAWSLGANGTGQVIAILDSGIDKTHPFLTGKVIGEACFGTNEAGGSYVASTFCPGAVAEGDSTGTDTAIPCTLSIVGCTHGTVVAGIAAGKNGLNGFNGVAKESKLLAIQVFSRMDSPSVCAPLGVSTCILAADVDILAALDFVYQNRNNYPGQSIAAVNLSLGSGVFTSRFACDSANPGYVAAVSLLHSAGIPVIASSGNQSKLFAMNAPACVTKVISVAASTDTDTIASFSNTASFLTFLAPGQTIVSSLPGGGYNNSTGDNDQDTTTDDYLFPANGTSFAAAHVSAAYAALRSYRPTASLSLIKDSLTTTGVNLSDVGGTFKRIQVDAAARAMIVPDQPVLYTPLLNEAFSEGPISFKWRPGADTDEYVLKVYKPDTTQLAKVTVAHDDCTIDDVEFGTICQVDLSAAYVDDAIYTWDVNAKNTENDTQALSETWSFQFDTPGRAVLIAPVDSITINAPTDLFQFQWNEVPLADSYAVTLYDQATKAVLATYTVAEVSVCAAEICTVAVEPAAQNQLADDSEYRWYVTSISPDGTSKSQVRKIFTQFPAATTLIQPAANGVFNDPSSPFIWTEVSDATSYKVLVREVASNQTVINETAVTGVRAVCDNGQCEFVLTQNQVDALKPENEYKWRVTSKNDLGSTPTSWSRFTTAGPGSTALITPINAAVFHDPGEISFEWATLTAVSTYKVIVKDLNNGKKLFKTKIEAITCGATCLYTPPANIQNLLKNSRTFRWWVVSANGLGSTNSVKQVFDTEYPGKPTLLTPADNLRLNDKSELVQFVWTPAPAAVPITYRIKVFRSDNKAVILNALLTPGVDVTCDLNTCTYSVPNAVRNALKDGKDYKWYVKAISDAGSSKSGKFLFKARF